MAWSGDGKTIYYIESVNATDSDDGDAAAAACRAASSPARTTTKSCALAPDGKTAVLCAGRKLYRLDLASGATTPIPFTARFELPPQSAADMVITHARVWDGTGSAPLDDRTIVIAGGKVASIGAGAPNAAAGRAGDRRARTNRDAGAHGQSLSLLGLRAGATAPQSRHRQHPRPGAPLSLSMSFKEAISLGLFPGPHIYSAGPLIDGLGDYHPLVDVMIDDTAPGGDARARVQGARRRPA